MFVLLLLLFCKNDYSFDYIIKVKGQKNTIFMRKKTLKKESTWYFHSFGFNRLLVQYFKIKKMVPQNIFPQNKVRYKLLLTIKNKVLILSIK